jgi:radical SAM superfamily enzyme YgiQ (UPF0313 family)
MRPFRILIADPAYGPHTPFWYVPLGAAYLAACVRRRLGTDVEIAIEREIDRIRHRIDTGRYDLVATTNYVWNSALSYAVLRHAKASAGDVITVQGGPQFQHLEAAVAEEYLRERPEIDYYVYGEGERTFTHLIEAAVGGSHITDAVTRGIALLDDGAMVLQERPERIQDLDEIPSPYLSGLLDDFLARGFTPIIETNRGCPFSCTYCNWGSATVAKVHTFSAERVAADLDYIAAHVRGNDHLTVADANFGLLPRDRDIALRIEHLWRTTGYPGNVHLWYAKNSSRRTIEIAEILGTKVRFLMAVQSLDPVVLANVKRRNILLTDYEKLADYARAKKLLTASDLIAGLPGESFASLTGAMRELYNRGSDKVDMFSLLLIPGTELYSRESRSQFRIRTAFRLADGCYAAYGDTLIAESEEVVIETATFREEDYYTLRCLKALTQFWHHGGLGDAISRYAREHHVSEPDLLLAVMDAAPPGSALAASLGYLRTLAESELFASHQALLRHVRDHADEIVATRIDFVYAQHLIRSGVAIDFIDAVVAALAARLRAGDGVEPRASKEELEALRVYTCQAYWALDCAQKTQAPMAYDVPAWLSAGDERPLGGFALAEGAAFRCERVPQRLPKADLGTLNPAAADLKGFHRWYDRIRNTREYFRYVPMKHPLEWTGHDNESVRHLSD